MAVPAVARHQSGVHAAKAPRPLVKDARVKRVLFDANRVYEIGGTYGYQTAVEFKGYETVQVVSIEGCIAW